MDRQYQGSMGSTLPRLGPKKSRGACALSFSTHTDEWRCVRCDKLLGICRDGRMHLRFARGHEYLVGFPVQAICRGCEALNNAEAFPR